METEQLTSDAPASHSILDTRETGSSHPSRSERDILNSNANDNQMAALSNLERTLSQTSDGEAVRFYPVAITESASLHQGGSIPGTVSQSVMSAMDSDPIFRGWWTPYH